MIGCDLGVLTFLKTFALMRSYIRYYTIKSGFSRKPHNKNQKSTRGRRKEWAAKLEKAKNYNDFMEIEIQEPKAVVEKPKETEDQNSEKKSWKLLPKTGSFGRIKDSIRDYKKSEDSTPADVPQDEKMRRTYSCAQLKHETIPVPISPTRSISNNALIETLTEHEELEKELGGMTGSMLLTTTSRLREARMQATAALSNTATIESISEDDLDSLGESLKGRNQQQYDQASSALKFLLSGVVKRNHLSVNDLLIKDARSVMECGRHELSANARDTIVGYHEEVERCLEWIAHSAPTPGYSNNGTVNDGKAPKSPTSSAMDNKAADLELTDRINLIRKLKHNMGRSALMLSGGGAQAMYHLGTIKALCESDLFDDIHVISGTSGGSITAAMCAIKTRDELLKDVCVETVSTDYRLTGQMKRENIRWFPKVVDMGAYWLKHKLLVDSEDFKRCCEFYYGDITFEEAFERTGKHVCITVSASRAESGGAQRLLLNHISTPHVTIASAVAASCALPGVMAPAKLRTKNNEGIQELFEVDGVEWIDGSVQADLPFKRISTLFNISNYIVCQTNFHVLPFLHKAHHPNAKSFYWRVFQTCEWDIRNRALNLSRLGLFPKLFGQDISKVFKQKYHGDVTLVPRFTKMQLFGLKSLVNPDVEDMKIYLQNGQSAAWPYLQVIKEMLRGEKAIDRCMARLKERRHQLTPDDWDDVESIASMTLSSRSLPQGYGARRETELLKEKILSLELENMELKKELNHVRNPFNLVLASRTIMKPPSMGDLGEVEKEEKTDRGPI